jgi:AraC-like DNA-binding protein
VSALPKASIDAGGVAPPNGVTTAHGIVSGVRKKWFNVSNIANLSGSKVAVQISMRERKCHSRAERSGATRNEKGTIAIPFVRAVADAAVAHGVAAETLLTAAGIRPALLRIDASRVSPEQYSRLWRRYIDVLGDEFFGQDPRPMKPGSFALLCRSVVHCADLGRALIRAARFFDVFLDEHGLTVSRSEQRARLTLVQRGGGSPRPFGHETLLVIAHGLACWLVGRRIPILAAAFAYPAPAHAVEYRDLFGPQLKFAAPETYVEFSAAFLDLPVVQSEASAKEFLRLAPANILLKYKSTQSLSTRIRRRLRQILPDDLPDLEQVAREMNAAPATLRRKLKAEGQTYQGIKDELRRDLAISYLSETELSIRDIALALGFLEPSAFHRAFRKWAQTSPGAYRRGDFG